MKSVIILLTSLLSIVSLVAQNNFCGTMQDAQMHQDFLDNKALWINDPLKTQGHRFVPVTFHLVADDNGNRRASQNSAYQALCILNERYDASNVDLFFYLKEFREVNDDEIHVDPFSAGSKMFNLRERRSMNVWIVNDIDNGSDNSITRGYYSRAGDFLVVRKDDIGDAGYTLEHEIGHFFTLKHTHYGWEDEPVNNVDYPEKITFTTISGSSQVPAGANIPVELADGSNCETAGDCICDTPADYGVGFSCSCCEVPYTTLDRNCDEVLPMMENVMSYSSNCMDRKFTPDQATAMNASYDATNRNYLRSDITEFEYRPVNQQVSLLTPESGEKVEVYNDILFSWEPVPNAEFYILDVDGDKYTVPGTEHRVFNREANEAFLFWSVRAYGPFGGGCNGAVERRFDTGDQFLDAVNELSYVSEIEFFPNPAAKGQALTLSFASQKSEAAVISLIDVTGRTISSNNHQIEKGQNQFAFDLTNAESGLLLMEVRTNSGSIVEKIIVE